MENPIFMEVSACTQPTKVPIFVEERKDVFKVGQLGRRLDNSKALDCQLCKNFATHSSEDEVPGDGKCQSGGSQSDPGGGQSPAGVGNQVQVVVKLMLMLRNKAVRPVTPQKVSFGGGV